MRVFITGSSGRIGTHIIPHLLVRGHTVTGLVRSTTSAETIKSFGSGVTPLIGTITDRDLLTTTAKSHDAVIHCAMDHGDMQAAVKLERDTILLFGDALEGSGKTLIMSSAAGFLEYGGDEHSMPSARSGMRGETDKVTLEMKDRGIRSISVRLGFNTHNPEKMHPFLGYLIGAADKLGYIPYLGENTWSACQADDAGLLYALALEHAKSGTAVHAFDEFNKIKDIAEALGKRTGLKVREVEKEKLGELGWLGTLLQMNQKADSRWTRETFAWEPKGQRLLAELEAVGDDYFTIDRPSH
ncbi:MAG: hypothetical protein TREMPRED_000998 [Tremellales sp. Tagirdzhanova-0007]|nr:MAG: hypothetical protein TREMPRED_000998 [Tremellales sp. Tagirdzhanova-0007]